MKEHQQITLGTVVMKRVEKRWYLTETEKSNSEKRTAKRRNQVQWENE